VLRLPYDHERYFELTPSTRIVELARLRPTRPPQSQPESVVVALERLADAAAGRIPRRAPLAVRPRNDDLEILDGNATYGAARALGWPDLPVLVEREHG
jgi:hypothetical protein